MNQHDDDDGTFHFQFKIPDDIENDQMAAQSWLKAFAKRLAATDDVRVRVRGHYLDDAEEGAGSSGDDSDEEAASEELTSSKATDGPKTPPAKGSGSGSGGTQGVPVVSILICPGKRPWGNNR